MTPKKDPSPAQLEARAKFGAAAKARAEAKRVEKSLGMQSAQPESAEVQAQPTPAQPDANDVDLLGQRIAELERLLSLQAPAPQQPFTPVRSITKYSVNAKDYPDPRDRLFQEPKLVLKNFNTTWWSLEYKVDRVQYDKDGVHYVEPRFTLELWHIIEDEETGEPSNKKYKVCSGMFFEDPESYIIVANERGIDVPEEIQGQFCDEMRYLAQRDWLVEAFYPPKPQKASTRTEQVIGNVLVEVVEINSVDALSPGRILAKAE